MHVRRTLIEGLGTVMIGLLCAIAGPGGAVKAQAPNLVQPWGLPPLPPGVGPVEKFADVSDTPQGKFLEGGSFDTQGTVVRGDRHGWVSYLTPDGKLVPVFNCNLPPGLGQTCEPQGTRWLDGKLYLTTRHRGILVYDPTSKELKTLVYTTAISCSKAPTISISTPREICSSPILGEWPGPTMADQRGRLPVLTRRRPAQGDGQRLVSERHSRVARRRDARHRGLQSGADVVCRLYQRSDDGLPSMPQGSAASDLRWCQGGHLRSRQQRTRRHPLRRPRQFVGPVGRSRRHCRNRSARHHLGLRADTKRRTQRPTTLDTAAPTTSTSTSRGQPAGPSGVSRRPIPA